jgi:hypothetical protein
VTTEETFADQWANTMRQLARVDELKSDRSDALQLYRQLQRHYPNDSDLQNKISELAAKR